MDLTLRILNDRSEALDLAPTFDVIAAEINAEFRDTPVPEAVGLNLIRRHFGDPEMVVATALDKDLGERLGLCVTAPLEDPLFGERLPLIVLLHVHPDHRHRGIAGHLVKAVSVELESRGIHQLAARAGHNDDALISMGERWGFVRHWEVMLRE